MTKEHRIIREVRRLAAENPDFVYKPPPTRDASGELVEGDTCKYVHEGKGSCLFGQAMMNTGDLTADAAPEFEKRTVSYVMGALNLRVPLDQQAWADTVQGGQDGGTPWGAAIAEADAALESEPCFAQ